MAKIKNPGYWRNFAIVSRETPDETLLTLDGDQIRDLYKTHGALLFRGYDLDTATFRAFAERFCTHAVLNESGGRMMVDEDQRIQTVNLGHKPFPLHPEMSREPWRPDICLFGCVVPPKSGGRTTLCDGIEIVKAMPPMLLKAFETRNLLYRKQATPQDLRYWLGTEHPSDAQLASPPEDCPLAFDRADRIIFRSFVRPALHKPMFADALCWGNYLLFSRFFNNHMTYPSFEDGSIVPDELLKPIRRIGDRLQVAVKWQANDVVMVDNSRFMHGRTRIKDVSHRHILTYFGYLDFAVPPAYEGPNPRWRNPAIWENVQMAA